MDGIVSYCVGGWPVTQLLVVVDWPVLLLLFMTVLVLLLTDPSWLLVCWTGSDGWLVIGLTVVGDCDRTDPEDRLLLLIGIVVWPQWTHWWTIVDRSPVGPSPGQWPVTDSWTDSQLTNWPSEDPMTDLTSPDGRWPSWLDGPDGLVDPARHWTVVIGQTDPIGYCWRWPSDGLTPEWLTHWTLTSIVNDRRRRPQ